MLLKTFLNKGQFTRKGQKDPADYSFHSTKEFFSMPSNMIPTLSGTSGGRVLLGSKATLQALSLVDREAPLVQSVAEDHDKSFPALFGKELLTVCAEKPGHVTHLDADTVKIKTKDGEEEHELYNHFNLGRKSFVHHTPQVKVGDHVKSGDILATSNYTDKEGTLALGVNLRTAVMPFRAGNFEDAFVLTESGAKKMDAEQIIKYRVDKKTGLETDKHKFVSIFPNKFFNKQLDSIDQDGVAKVGSILNPGDPIVLGMNPKTMKTTDIQLGKLAKALKNAYSDATQTWDFQHAGEVVDVSKSGDHIAVNIKTRRSMQPGDKLSCSFGAKGVINDILPMSKTPVDKDGKPVDIILNSMSITSRVAPALAVAIAMAKVAQKIGKPVKVKHFDSKSAVQKAIDALKEHGLSDSEMLTDPATGKEIEVVTGPLYVERLVHISEDKQSGRSQGVGYDWNSQPTKSDEESSKRIGNLSTASLLAHGANAVLKDIALIKSTKNDEYWRRLKLGLPVPSPEVPFIFNKFISHLQGAGINVKKNGNIFQILPMTNPDIAKLSAGAIDNPLTFKVKDDKLTSEPGGLFDETKTGIFGTNYNHVELNHAVPNPISEDYLRKLFNVTQKQYDAMIVSGEIKDRLNNLDVDAKIQEYKNYLKSGKKVQRDSSVKVLSFLNTLKQNNIAPKDLLLTKVPIIPAQFRPILVQGHLRMSADVNNLYKDLMLNNDQLKDTDHLPDEIKNKLKQSQYDSVKAVFGLGDPISMKHKEKNIKGLLATTLGFRGGSGKATMFQSKVVNKPVDLVGRAVVIPDSKLDLDEASIPQDIIWQTYTPFIIRGLITRGVPATKAVEYVENKNPMAEQVLMEELKTRPGIISRDPSLHKYNLTGFYLKPNSDPKDKTLHMNPLVCKSFGMDFDGDQVNVNIPAGEDARQEIIDRMLPSKMLRSPKDFRPVYLPSNESALGLYQASTESNNNPSKNYKVSADVVKDFNLGRLDIGDQIELD